MPSKPTSCSWKREMWEKSIMSGPHVRFPSYSSPGNLLRWWDDSNTMQTWEWECWQWVFVSGEECARLGGDWLAGVCAWQVRKTSAGIECEMSALKIISTLVMFAGSCFGPADEASVHPELTGTISYATEISNVTVTLIHKRMPQKLTLLCCAGRWSTCDTPSDVRSCCGLAGQLRSPGLKVSGRQVCWCQRKSCP